jgi:bifunctional UDP-N-acetylglucosamine pyrophosphorylase/glucosamine-1-phosphate N-acetyltransferase
LKKKVAVIILAAGKSTRMKSDTPKVLHPICGRPMIGYVLDLVGSFKAAKVITVLGYRHQQVRKILKASGIKVVIQKRLLGTADAVKEAMPLLRNFKGTVLVLYADNPLLKKESIQKLIKYHAESNSDATLLTALAKKPAGYGRILRDKYSSICGIREEKDADEVQRDIKEINTGVICFNKEKLDKALKGVRANNRKKEYYLTDTIEIIYKNGGMVNAVRIAQIQEALGINSRADLALANSIMQKRINEDFMLKGITIVDPASTFIGYGTKIGRDSTIYPFTVIESGVKIGKSSSVGPFAHLREGTELKDNVVLGNFAETVRSRLGRKSCSRHFSYLGDARIGRGVNIGAGTVTANFNGKKKNRTLIKDKAFIGSDTVLVAPVTVGKSAVTGAGSAVIRNVADKSVVVGVPAKPLKRRK